MSAALEAEILGLESLGLDPLREVWRARYGPPPRLRSAALLRRMLAWKIQAQALGGLDAETVRALRGKPVAVNRGPQVAPGMRLVREFRGERHEVEITEGGVRYRGASYASLSEAARTITGVRWNGPRFFGLRGAS